MSRTATRTTAMLYALALAMFPQALHAAEASALAEYALVVQR